MWQILHVNFKDLQPYEVDHRIGAGFGADRWLQVGKHFFSLGASHRTKWLLKSQKADKNYFPEKTYEA